MKNFKISLVFALLFSLSALASESAPAVTIKKLAPYGVDFVIEGPLKAGVNAYRLVKPVTIGASRFEMDLLARTWVRIENQEGKTAFKSFERLIYADHGPSEVGARLKWIQIGSEKFTSLNLDTQTWLNFWTPTDPQWSSETEIYADGNLKSLVDVASLRSGSKVPAFSIRGLPCKLDGGDEDERIGFSFDALGKLDGCGVETAIGGAPIELPVVGGQTIRITPPAGHADTGARVIPPLLGIRFHANGSPRSVYEFDHNIEAPDRAVVVADLKVIAGDALHRFSSRYGTGIELDEKGRVLLGMVIGEPLIAGSVSATYDSMIQYRDGAYQTWNGYEYFTNTKAGFFAPGADTTKTLDAFCLKNGDIGFGSNVTDYIYGDDEFNQSISLQHKSVYGTEDYFDISSGLWTSVTDQPVDFLQTIVCAMPRTKLPLDLKILGKR